MKKINLKGISEILSSKELKNVTGGSAPVVRPPGCGTGHLPAGALCERNTDCRSCWCVVRGGIITPQRLVCE